MAITQRELDKFGYTVGCPGCEARKRGLIAKTGHNENCRRRIEEMMRKDDDAKERIEATNMRMGQHLARNLEEEDRTRKTQGDATEEETRRQ